MLFTMAKAVNMRVPRPEKHAAIVRTSFMVIGWFFSGRRKEKGHQMKSLSLIQLETVR